MAIRSSTASSLPSVHPRSAADSQDHPTRKFGVLSKRTLLWLKSQLTGRKPPSPEQRAKDLITAVDAGGLPLHPARVNDIARQLGLEVSSRAPMPETIERIRQALARC